MSNIINNIRSLPLATRRALLVTVIGIIGIALFIVWIATDFGLSTNSKGLEAVSDGAEGVAQIIQEQTEDYQKQKEVLQANIEQTLRSSALIMPPAFENLDEDPDGVLYLGYEHRESGTQTVLDKIEFYPSFAVISATVTNNNEDSVFFDAARGSALVQDISAIGEVSYQPLYQINAPAELVTGEPVQIGIVFGPVNGRNPFELVIGDFASELDPGNSQSWASRFQIDPQKIIK